MIGELKQISFLQLLVLGYNFKIINLHPLFC